MFMKTYTDKLGAAAHPLLKHKEPVLVAERDAAARVDGRNTIPRNLGDVLAVRVPNSSFPRAAAPDIDAARCRRDGAVRVREGAGAGAHAAQRVEPARRVAITIGPPERAAVAVAPGEDATVGRDGGGGERRARDL